MTNGKTRTGAWRLVPGMPAAMSPKKGVSMSELLLFWVRQFFVVGGGPVHCRIFDSIPGPSQDVSSTWPIMRTKHVSRHCQVSSGGENHCQLRPAVLS